jgi:short-subunit dehydrogenase
MASSPKAWLTSRASATPQQTVAPARPRLVPRARLSAAVLPGIQARRFGRIINIGSEAGVAIVPGLAAYCVSKHALVALTEVIQDGNRDNGIKAWVICPGFVDTAMGYVVPGASPATFLTVEEVVDTARYLLHTGDNVKLGPQILVQHGAIGVEMVPGVPGDAARVGDR